MGFLDIIGLKNDFNFKKKDEVNNPSKIFKKKQNKRFY